MSELHDDTRVIGYEPLIQPALLCQEIPLTEASRNTILASRTAAANIIHGRDDRVLVVVGPCSIHDPKQALEYASRLKEKADAWGNLLIIMRAYFEKPRTTVGWKGSINDPDIDGTFKINKGLRTGRQLLSDITSSGLPVGCELLDTISPQFLGQYFSWAAIGARTTESQLHRELASGSSFPIGFKNATNGDVGVATDGCRASAHPHAFMGVNSSGLASVVKTRGNSDCHIILRGGTSGPNYDRESVSSASKAMSKSGLDPSIMIDCSHGNSQKDYRNQPKVLDSICEQLREGERGIVGVMIESNLEEGSQKVPDDPSELKWGVSITDACVGWPKTVEMLDKLNEAASERRKKLPKTTNGTH